MTKHTQIKAKCLRCGLHFVICTWHPERHTADTITCPECGQKDGMYCVWEEKVPDPIFTVVPGPANLTELCVVLGATNANVDADG